MYYLKRNYSACWSKYNYLLEAEFDVAVSAIIQTFALDFRGSFSLKWWGNTVATAGVDYQSYNQKAPLKPIPAVGYFGLKLGTYPEYF